MRRRTGAGDGAPGRRRKSSRSTSYCSQGIDWVADEDVEVQIASERFKSNGENRTEGLPPKTVNSSKRRQTWSPEEDKILIQLVNLHSPRKWSTIACSMPGRRPHQCRERWVFCVDPAVNKQPWSEHEEITLLHAHQIHGNKWSELAKLFPGRTAKAVKYHWARLQKKNVRSHSAKRSADQFPHRPIYSLIRNNKASSTNKSVQDSPTNIHVSSEMPARPKLEQALTGSGRNPSTLTGKTSDITQGNGSVPHSVIVSPKVDGQIITSSLPLVTEVSADRKVPLAVASLPMSQREEMTDSVAVVRPNNNVCTDFSPARSLLSDSDHSDGICCSADNSESPELHLENLADLLDMPYCDSLMIIPDDICCSADSESREPHLANLADLLDMPYCDSLMIIPPGSPDDEA